MGITMFGIGGLLAPLHSLVNWIAEGAPKSKAAASWRPVPPGQATAPRGWSRSGPPANCRARPSRPLRVVRVLEGSRSPGGAGRMVISGRLADVCAELDRLAALEATTS